MWGYFIVFVAEVQYVRMLKSMYSKLQQNVNTINHPNTIFFNLETADYWHCLLVTYFICVLILSDASVFEHGSSPDLTSLYKYIKFAVPDSMALFLASRIILRSVFFNVWQLLFFSGSDKAATTFVP